MAGEYICVGMTVRVRPTDGPLADITLVKGQMNDVTISQMMDMGRGTP